MKGKNLTAIAVIAALMLGCCGACNDGQAESEQFSEQITQNQTDETENDNAAEQQENTTEEQTEQAQTHSDEEEQEQTEESAAAAPTEEETEQAAAAYATYIKVTGTSVNIRAGAGTGNAVLGTAEQNTLYANLGQSGGWYKTQYQNKTVYISANYCEEVEIEASQSEAVENVIAEGLKLMGVEYVYGAVRYHDGTGKLNSGFTITEFDCSSLTQYIFYKGADVLLQVNTRTQVYQGEHVEQSDLRRGDLMFFTNDSRYNNTGIERVGHVAVYLGDNYILHTSSDYAKIEQLTTKRWNYFLEARRMV